MSGLPNSGTIAKASQDCLVDWLRAGAEFARVPIIGRRKGNITNDIEAAIAAIGACIYVMPGLPISFISSASPVADRYELRIRCIENKAINETLPDCEDLAEFVIRRVYGTDFSAIGLRNPLVFAPGRPVAPQEDGERDVVDVIFETDVAYPPRIES